MDNVVTETFNKLMRNQYERQASVGFTKNISLTGTAPVPADVKQLGLDLSKARGIARHSLMGGRPWPSFIHEAQLKYIARDAFCHYFPPDTPNASVLNRIGFTKLTKTRYEKLRKKVRTPYVTSVLSSFYKRNDRINWWQVFRQLPTWCMSIDDEIKVIYRFALSFQDAMHPVGMKSLPMEYRTDTVMNLIRNMRKTGDMTLFPILADALCDAGFDSTVQGSMIVAQYRNPEMVHTFGSWIFKTTGNLEYSGGSGTDKPDSDVPAESSDSA